MKGFILIIGLGCVLAGNGFAQPDSTVSVFFSGAKMVSGKLEAVDPHDLKFKIEDTAFTGEAMQVSVLHHRGRTRFYQAMFKFNSPPLDFVPLRFPQIKPGDQLTFTFQQPSRKLEWVYQITSTVDQLAKPYYFDVYVIYNTDTLDADAYNLRLPLALEKKRKFIRVLVDDTKPLPPILTLTIKRTTLQYNLHFHRGMLYHGKVYLEYLDKPKLKEKVGYGKSVTAIDLGIGKEFIFNEQNSQ